MKSTSAPVVRAFSLTVALFAAVTALSPASGWCADLVSLLSGKDHPLTVTIGSLSGDWRRFTIHPGGNASGNVSVSVTGSGGTSGSSQNNIADLTGSRHYLTQGQTVTVGDQIYLVAYRLPGGGLDFSGLLQALATKTPPTPTILTKESALPLSLLDLKGLGNLEDIRAFDLKREIAESEKLAATIANALKSASAGSTNSPPPSTNKSGK